MKKEDFRRLAQQQGPLKSHRGWALLTLGRVILFTLAAVFFSYSENPWIWFGGQILYGLAVLQWFVLMHDFGHNYFFKSKNANWIWGHVASFFCLAPFTPWKYIHGKHHTWTGWHDLDPTMESTLPALATPLQRKAANLIWKSWLPLLSLAFSFKNFWNYPRLARYWPQRSARWEFIFSISFIVAVLALQILFVPHFWKVWALGYFIFLVISDPLLISQHSHIPQRIAGPREVRPFPVYEQEVYTRSLLFPAWVSKYLLLNFDAHIAHHIFPTVACYHLHRIHYRTGHEYPWWDWLKKAKSVPAEVLLFSHREDSGLDL